MKIKTEVPMDDLVVPKIIETAFKKFKKEFWDKSLNEEENFRLNFWFDWLEESGLFKSEKDKLINKEIADFVIGMGTGFCPFDGKGYPILNEFCFEDSGYKYSICTFGWQVMEGEPHLQTVGYKERIIKKGEKKWIIKKKK